MAKDLTPGEVLRLWRTRQGKSLEVVAFAVDQLAKLAGADPKGKKIPRTHASLSRWETGKSEVKEAGLRFLAEVYGVQPGDLRKPPPPEGSPPTRTIEVPSEQEPVVAAFLKALGDQR